MFKKGYEFSFAWIFAILTGATIIFLAIYFATQISSLKRVEQQTEVGKEIGILLNPVETNLEQAKFVMITLRTETKIYNKCNSGIGNFGSQELSAKIKSGLGEEWTNDPGVASSFYNKYLFSNDEIYGKKIFYVLAKPFKFPFKPADLKGN